MTLFDIDSRPRDPSVRRLKLVIAYAGTDFRGFAVQPDVRTVQGVLSDALAMVLNVSVEELRFSCAGRTDAGVHAWGQVVAIDAPADIDLIRIARSVNRLLGPEVVVRSVDEVAPSLMLGTALNAVLIATQSLIDRPPTHFWLRTLGG